MLLTYLFANNKFSLVYAVIDRKELYGVGKGNSKETPGSVSSTSGRCSLSLYPKGFVLPDILVALHCIANSFFSHAYNTL